MEERQLSRLVGARDRFDEVKRRKSEVVVIRSFLILDNQEVEIRLTENVLNRKEIRQYL